VNYTDPEGPKFLGNLAGPPPVFSGTLKVVSYNIKLSRDIDQAIRELESIPQLSDPDVLLLQEMDPIGVRTIAERLRFNYVYYPAVIHSTHDKGFGNAVLSPWPITNHMKLILPHEHPVRKMNRNAVFATLSIADFQLLAVSVHTEVFILGNERRLDQVEAVVNHIGATAKGDPLGIIRFEMDFLFVKGLSATASGKAEEAGASDHLPIWATLRLDKIR
jgi:endonuclease/exonuclease/phosphatase family metal-dependent hydrolase